MSLRWYLIGQSRKRASVHCDFDCDCDCDFDAGRGVFNGRVCCNKTLYGCCIDRDFRDLSTKIFHGSNEWDCRGADSVTCTRSVAPFLQHSPVPGDV